MSTPNSVRFSPDEWREFKDFLIGEGFYEEKTKGKYETCRLRCRKHGDDPIIINRNSKNDSLVVHGGRGLDLWYEFIQE